MADALWPFEQHFSFEDGTTGDWDSTFTNAAGVVAVSHYTDIARIGHTPHAGAYVGKSEFLVNTDSARAGWRTDAITLADGTTDRFQFRFYVCQHSNWTAENLVKLLRFGAGGTVSGVFGIVFNADLETVDFGVGPLDVTVLGGKVEPGNWYTVQILTDIVDSGSGTISAWVTKEGEQDTNETVGQGTPHATSNDGDTLNEAIDRVQLGGHGVLGSTNTTILFDEFIMATGDVVFSHPRPPFGRTQWMGKSGHLFVGPGKVCDLTLQSGAAATDNVLELWDTDRADTTDFSRMKARLATNAPNETVNLPSVPITFNRGCYVVMTPFTPDEDDPVAVITAKPVHDTRATRLQWAKSAGLPGA